VARDPGRDHDRRRDERQRVGAEREVRVEDGDQRTAAEEPADLGGLVGDRAEREAGDVPVAEEDGGQECLLGGLERRAAEGEEYDEP
jgi:hypothetical protein